MLFGLLSSLPEPARRSVASLAIDGTSATAMLVDAGSGRVLAPPKLYNEAQGPEAVAAAKVRQRGRWRSTRPRRLALLGAGGLDPFVNTACPLRGCQTPSPRQAIAPPAHTAAAATSTLCKLLTWHQSGVWQAAAGAGLSPALLHQADWLASLLHGQRDVSDWNNALKLGYDPEAEGYPEWLLAQVGLL